MDFNPLHWTQEPISSPVDNFTRRADGCNNTDQLNTWYPPEGGAFATYDPEAVGRDMARIAAAGAYGIILDYQLPDNATRDGQTLRRSCPVAIAEAERHGLKWAIMYDASNPRQKNFRHGDAAVDQEWSEIIALA